MKVEVLLCLVIVVVCAAVPTQLTYTLGQNYVYNVTGVVQNNGYDTSAGQYVPGYYSVMKSTMVMQPIQENATAYLFVMNLFNTVVSVANTTQANSVGDSGNPLGYDMYFVQLKTGQIPLIEYNVDDSIYYVNVKVGAINAFQTSIVGVGNSLTVLESDPIGNHAAKVSGSLGANGVLLLTKVFNQVDFSAFPDPTLTPQNMQLNANAVTGVHPEGYVVSSTLNQVAVMVDISSSQTNAPNKASTTNSTGFDMYLSAIGSLTVAYLPVSDFVSKSFAPKLDGYVSDNFFGFASKANAIAQTNAFTINIEEAIVSMLKAPEMKLTALTKIGNHLRHNPKDVMYIIPLLEDSNLMQDPILRDRLFFVLTVLQNQDLLVKYGLQSANCDVLMRAVLAAPHFTSPQSQLISALRTIADSDLECSNAQASARSILLAKETPVTADDFPFNKSFNANINLGGAIAGIDLTAGLFVGTNLNCHNSQFNFEGSAGTAATATLFGYKQEAFDAQIVYGQENGSPLADALTVKIWGNVVYNHPIPAVACKAGTYPIVHSAPGFSITHTLWVSIIPIVFSASASLDLDLVWGWNLCTSQLSANVYVDGDSGIELAGSSYTDLILLRAGFELSGSFKDSLVPQAFVQGTLCQAGLEADEIRPANTASVISYFEWRTCKVLFIDCEWTNYNQHTWWGWSAPATTIVLYKQTFPIV